MSILQIIDVCAHYDRVQALEHITAHIASGELVTLIGANASGKSTLVRILAGLQKPTHGKILYPNIKNTARPPIGLAIDPEKLPYRLTGKQALQLVAATLETDITQSAIAYANLVALSKHLDNPIGTYSLGTKQKLTITLALVGEPQLLLLDESVNGLDLLSAGKTLEFLHEYTTHTQKSALLVTHNLDLAQHHTDRVWLLDQGKLINEWNPADIQQMREDKVLLSRYILDFFKNSVI